MDIDTLVCTIIANAGDSKNYSNEAIAAAKVGNFESADSLLKSSSDSLLIAHEAHTKLLFSDCNDVDFKNVFLLIHAANHFSAAESSREFAEAIVDIYRKQGND